ncbi:MAG: hypothetical protein JSR46_09225, partial [Verrucomicrobia bacterium]|nr:hypothetical protein [Verrucomicrobiota bacterium]
MNRLRDNYCTSNTALTLEEQKLVIEKVSNRNGSVLQKLMRVCTTWQQLIGSQEADVLLWKPVFDMHEKQVTYPIDLSRYPLYQDKLKVSLATRKEDFRQLLNSSNARFNFAPPLNEKSDLTDLFKRLIQSKQIEKLALYLLFRPSFDVDAIATMLRRTFTGPTTANTTFCEKLLIKLHYNVPKLLISLKREAAL